MSRNVIHRRRMPSATHGAAASPTSRDAAGEIRLAALALGGTALLALVCLVLLYVVHGPFGTVNDLANAGIGWLALVLAALVRGADHEGRQADGAVLAAAAGAVGLTWGSYLVITETTGFYLAGLVSTLGLASLGGWMLLAHRASGAVGLLGTGPERLGRVVGWLLAGGVLALPGVLAGVDDIADAQWHSYLAQASAWLGAYVLLPVWSLRVARHLRRA
ncbi:hypothetical protein [Terrabacter sp. MAHUQ-38]|uniref:hypothetical protein n=1 Tax=unclassified Terrabacter TaxID=2630222 RepID=UPI00165DC2BC|nr:hypothetical protein [Terrabacter sp. MAHUQ-38]MBC9820801.1 hypothetical protein [Terrabacter sp. MAHUQ-38]